MNKVLIPIVFLVLFQGILLVLSSTSFVLANSVNNGFLILIDTISKAATVAVFFWAIYLFYEQQKERVSTAKQQRIKELSFRLIDFVGDINFSLNKSSANILITYLDTLKSEYNEGYSNQVHEKEHKLALDIVRNALKSVNLKDILNIEGNNDSYREVLSSLKKYYFSENDLIIVDKEFSQAISSGIIANTNRGINVPSHGLRLWQVEKILGHVLELDKETVKHRLIAEPTSIMDFHHQLPTLSAFYYFYHHSHLSIDKNKNFTLTTNGPLTACER